RHPPSPLFPYTTLFRSILSASHGDHVVPSWCQITDGDRRGSTEEPRPPRVIRRKQQQARSGRLAILHCVEGQLRAIATEHNLNRSEEHTSELQSLRHLV